MSKIELTPAIKERIIYDIQEFFAKEREEHIGNIESERLLEFMMKKVGPMFYNQAIFDAHSFMEDKVQEVYLLELESESEEY